MTSEFEKAREEYANELDKFCGVLTAFQLEHLEAEAHRLYTAAAVKTLFEFQLDCMTDMEGANLEEFDEAENAYQAADIIAERLGLKAQLQEAFANAGKR